jgi:hypothetical protein
LALEMDSLTGGCLVKNSYLHCVYYTVQNKT